MRTRILKECQHWRTWLWANWTCVPRSQGVRSGRRGYGFSIFTAASPLCFASPSPTTPSHWPMASSQRRASTPISCSWPLLPPSLDCFLFNSIGHSSHRRFDECRGFMFARVIQFCPMFFRFGTTLLILLLILFLDIHLSITFWYDRPTKDRKTTKNRYLHHYFRL